MNTLDELQEMLVGEYDDLREVPNRGVCGVKRFLFTSALVYGLDDFGYVGRYCYHTMSEAKSSLSTWDGSKDPDGDWIKHKGYTEYSNPNSS